MSVSSLWAPALLRVFALATFALLASALVSLSPEPASAQTGSTKTVYVNSSAGSDTAGDGTTPGTAYRTIGRALADIPAVVDAAWTIQLASGNYAESVELRRFVMPSMISYPQLRNETISRSITILGDGGAVITPTSGAVCITASSVVLFVQALTCRTSGGNGITAAGASLVLDDVRIEATTSATYGIYGEMSLLYLGGTIAVEGPFTNGLVARSNALARAGTRRNPETIDLTFRGLSSHAIFVRDGGNFTTAFERGTVRVIDSGQVMYALLGSRIFLTSTVPLEMQNVRAGVAASQLSAINVSQTTLTGDMPNPFVRCHKASYVALEQVTAPSPRPMDTDGTCMILKY